MRVRLNRRHSIFISFILIIGAVGIGLLSPTFLPITEASAQAASSPNPISTAISTAATPGAQTETAIFAGGCFWCMEQPFDSLPGVISTTSGYTGGQVDNPTYYQVSNGDTGHVEAVAVEYDPAHVSYDTLLDTFWRNIDPLDDRGQFCDKGSQYRSAVFYQTSQQQTLAEMTKTHIAEELGRDIATDIRPAQTFYPAEDYHQDYYLTHPVRYKVYRFGCGRDQRLADVWGSAIAHP